LEEIINKALEKDRELRYQNASDLRTDLKRLKRDTESGRKTPQSVLTAEDLRETAKPGITTVSSKSSSRRLESVSSTLESPVSEPARPRNWKMLAAAAALLFVVAAGAFFLSHARRGQRLTEKDTLVVADFSNTTGDPLFDGALRQGLSSQLEQSPFLNLLSDERVAQTLALMAQAKDARLTRELAREVCQRTAGAATIEGSISSLGSQYVLGLRAVNCRNGDLLAQEQATASGKEQVLKALGVAANKIREKLGESLASVQKFDAPPDNVTTPSLEALQTYSLGSRAQIVRTDYAAAIPLFQRAISLDPNFAMAYSRLGTNYSDLGQTARAAESTRKAYELRDRVSERERFYIVSHYEHFVTGNLEAARKAYELWAQTYPRDDIPAGNLGVIYISLGDYEKGLAACQESLKINPGSGIAYVNLVNTYVNLNRLDEATTTAQEAQAHNLDSPSIHLYQYLVGFGQHDSAMMEREAAALVGKPGFEDLMLYNESDTAAYAGQFAKARELTRRAVGSAKRADQKETAAGYVAEAAVRETLVGNAGFARQQAEAALALSNGRDVEAVAAIALGLAGNSAHATQLANDLARRFPEDTLVQFNYLPTILAAAVLGGDGAVKDGDKAIAGLAAAAPYELGTPAQTITFALYPVYLRGEAYLAAKQGTAAAREFQKILDHPGVVLNEPISALAHVGLGRAYAISSDRSKSRTAYQDFFALWKDADPDIPILKQAKSEYAKLQ
jgi:tetratricopeptide (TPR) repeat protein